MKTLFSNLLFILSTISYLVSYNFALALDQFSESCKIPKPCGNQTVKFPFYLKGIQQPSRGYNGFELTCDGKNRPILNLSGDNYVVHKISYENKTLIISNTAFSVPDSQCIPSIQNLSLSTSKFTLGLHQQVFLLYGCQSYTGHVVGNYSNYNIGCARRNKSNMVLAFPREEIDHIGKATEMCGTRDLVEVPVTDYERENSTINKELLNRGFVLNWSNLNESCEKHHRNSSAGLCEFDCFERHKKSHRSSPGKSKPLGLKGAPMIALVVCVPVLGVIITILCLLWMKSKYKETIFFWKKKNRTYQNFEALLRTNGPIQVRRYCYNDVKKMTERFSEKLGRGGFGDVYKGKLVDRHVAVKVWNRTKGEDGEEFINEVATISRTSHVNVVTLLGFCFEGSKRALIYEFMPNGSLEKFIFRKVETGNNWQLDWETRYQIALGIARGLEYLHRGCNTRILHFDIKPHNILLDADFVPKISDFGLAKICPKKENSVSVLGPRGTIGYIAPEIFSSDFGGVTYKSDVYSYGVMILEMVGGRKNIINRETGKTSEIHFAKWMYKRIELDEDQLGLKSLISNEEERVRVRKMIITSLWCIQTDPSHRPTMSKVIEMLEGNVNSLKVPTNSFLSSPSTSPPMTSSSLF